MITLERRHQRFADVLLEARLGQLHSPPAVDLAARAAITRLIRHAERICGR